MGALKLAIGDAILTFLWVFFASTLGAITFIIGSYLGVQGLFFDLFCMVFLVLIMLFIFGFIAVALGGASFNPTDFAVFYAAGVKNESLFSASLRLPAQVYIQSCTYVCMSKLTVIPGVLFVFV